MGKSSYINSKNKKFKKQSHKIFKIELDYESIIKRLKIKVINNPLERCMEIYNNDKQHNKVTYRTKGFVLRRLTLNYIRHNFTNYDKVIKNVSMSRRDLDYFKARTNVEILKKYGKNFIQEEIRIHKLENEC